MRNLLTALIIVFTLADMCQAQIKIDLKTKIVDKSKTMEAIKEGMKRMMERVAWIKLGEVGEKYSLWVEELVIQPKASNPSISVVNFKLELRSPAMFTHGKLLQSSSVTFESDFNAPLPFNNPPELERSLVKLDDKTHMSSASWIATAIGTAGTAAMAKVFVKVGSMFQSNFTETEKTTGVLAGYYTIDVLYTMLKANGDFK